MVLYRQHFSQQHVSSTYCCPKKLQLEIKYTDSLSLPRIQLCVPLMMDASDRGGALPPVTDGELILLRNADVYAPQHIGLRSLLLGGGRVLAISDVDVELPESLGGRIIDLSGRKVCPGYVDCHSHITGGGGENGFSSCVPAVGISQYTKSGVTTVVGLLGTDDVSRTTGSVISRVHALREEGMSAYCWTGGYHYPLTTLTGSAKSDIAFIEPVIGIGEFAISDHRSSQPTYDEFIRLASDAYVAGLLSKKAGILHLHLGDGPRKLEFVERALTSSELPARTFHPTHVNRNKALFEDACDLVKRFGIYADITAFPLPCCGKVRISGKGWFASDAVQEAIKNNVPLNKLTISSDGGGSMPMFDEAGVLKGMDFGRPTTLHATVLEMLSAGLDLSTILPMLTSNVADLMRFDRKGRIAVGKDADLLVLNTEDHSIECVMALGKWHIWNGQTLRKGTFE